jgi:hypothetical protein
MFHNAFAFNQNLSYWSLNGVIDCYNFSDEWRWDAKNTTILL